jgi:hypothetical protein
LLYWYKSTNTDTEEAAASPGLSSAIRLVLAAFHNKKKFKAVDEMLARIYEPILWRAFKVANAGVRVQAAQLLAEAFPVQDPEAPAKEVEEGLTRQITVLDALLKDGVPRVREVAVHCVCRVLSVYLELLPLHTATAFLGLLIKDLASDSGAASVRVAVLRGLAVVLDNHVSHPLLASRLPLLADRIHDTSESVRAAMADLLLKVRSVKVLRLRALYWYTRANTDATGAALLGHPVLRRCRSPGHPRAPGRRCRAPRCCPAVGEASDAFVYAAQQAGA